MKGQNNRWRSSRDDRPRHSNPVWRLSKQLCLEIYGVTADFPSDERFGLQAQIRRAAVSVMSNIAEGAARGSTKSYVHFLYTARASLEEVDAQLELAGDLGYLDDVHVRDAIATFEDLSRSLQGLINALNQKLKCS